MTLILYILIFIDQIATPACSDQKGACKIFFFFLIFIEFAAYISMIGVYSWVGNKLAAIDPALMKYAAENKCSDGALQVAFTKYSSSLQYSLKLNGLGLAFTLASLLVFIISFVFGLWNGFARCCKCCYD